VQHGPFGLIERTVDLDEPAVGQLPDDAGLDPVRQHLLVLPLQTQADSPGQDKRDDWPGEHHHPCDPGGRVQRDRQLVRDDVVPALDPQHRVERDRRHPGSGPDRRVPGPVVDVVIRLVPGRPPLKERPQRRAAQHDGQRHRERDEHAQRQRVPQEVDLPGRHDPQRALEQPHVEVGLRRRGDGHRGVRPVQPDRVDLSEGGQQGQRREDEEEPGPALGHEIREERLPDHVLLSLPQPRHLGVLLVHHDEQVRRDQRQDQPRNQQHVQEVHPRQDRVPGERPAEQEESEVGADDRDALQDAFQHAQACAGQLVVGQRIAEQPLGQAEGKQHDADQPVDLAGLAVGAGEEHPQHVRHDRGHEQVGRPVVDLPQQQAAADIEADVQRRLVGLAHRDAVELGVRAVVDHRGRGRDEEERQEGPGQQQDDERPQRDLAEHERPVVGKDLPHEHPEPAGSVEPVIQPPARGAQARTRIVAVGHYFS
jgi:hypothetical protein